MFNSLLPINFPPTVSYKPTCSSVNELKAVVFFRETKQCVRESIFIGYSRGFAFVEFLDVETAKRWVDDCRVC